MLVEDFFKGRDIQTAANVLQKPGVIGRLGLTQKKRSICKINELFKRQ